MIAFILLDPISALPLTNPQIDTAGHVDGGKKKKKKKIFIIFLLIFI